MADHTLGGVIAAVPTPLGDDGQPDCALFLEHAQWSLNNGCDGLNVLGTTGEANSLSADQRKTVMDAASDNLARDRLMVGTGTPDLPTTIDLTRFAYEKGFAAALVLPPYYYKPVSDDGLFAWFEALITRTSDTPIPIYLYNFPQLTGITFSAELAARLSETFPQRMFGMKDSSGNLEYAANIAGIDGFDVFPSSETALARAKHDNYAGCISATVNINAPQAARLWANPDDDSALESVTQSRGHIASFPLVPAVKQLIAKRMNKAGFASVLPPLLALSNEQCSALANGFREA
ncbi:MAG: dihydrodipicolinate synthase family protein [Alphaproteobacteria bacterium]|nr:dihydrodipicolinate synthase family protein [Alphaproteobacteria bacterium]